MCSSFEITTNFRHPKERFLSKQDIWDFFNGIYPDDLRNARGVQESMKHWEHEKLVFT
ncbi:hypothetical protein K503DRAFT_777755 [Rhizopogon vinicolor AM-OR11-026]|uniref:Uncharacterized protein n=1 Tax=Rhizopogon vinicolor AM-OR11-026 TaxID=1314800 RepID=A0A1B7MF55_9AGAM|nr:hypothetical protein K503DRAFT_777755 [Rhizopogon vinicolor AM-OR11-026]